MDETIRLIETKYHPEWLLIEATGMASPDLIRREIRNRTIRSFLYYVPYVTLSVMTFPAILSATGSTAAGMLALAAGIICAWFGAGLFPVAAACSTVVFIAGFFL